MRWFATPSAPLRWLLLVRRARYHFTYRLCSSVRPLLVLSRNDYTYPQTYSTAHTVWHRATAVGAVTHDGWSVFLGASHFLGMQAARSRENVLPPCVTTAKLVVYTSKNVGITSGQGPRSHGVQGVNWPPLFQVRGPHMALDAHFLSCSFVPNL